MQTVLVCAKSHLAARKNKGPENRALGEPTSLPTRNCSQKQLTDGGILRRALHFTQKKPAKL
jgi:hypothetical protein